MIRPLLVATALALLVPALAGARGPSTAEERRRAVQTTRKLEKDPLARDANDSRRWLLDWIVAIPDVQVRSCSGPLDVLVEDSGPHGRALYLQSIFGMATYLIEHPRAKDDWVAVQTAGIESVLRAYRSLLRADPEARRDELDALLDTQKRGRLAQLVEDSMAECGKPPKDEGMGPAPRGSI
ncbi:hypothetical protein [Anaeromyxobacter sp. SG17]|uniref:hypothetical protein n=1 Tax=Anaeromyxobacter sp. SG17 TaxID=2925405 RepID=UPI001F5A98AB|nr:hypothetical protein [Anaeromyxobacter sp. SG17]